MGRLRWTVAAVLLAGLFLAVFGLLRPGGDVGEAPQIAGGEESAERGRYLARVGNCAGCHTAPGGQPFAGGLALESDLGTFYTPNITPDAETGIGDWSADAFWGALHFGVRPDGRSLYPACPYPSLTKVTRSDVNAIYAYLRTVPAVTNETPPHELDFPFNQRWLLPIWKGLFFEPGTYRPAAEHREAWNRGRYLVQGLGHCNECHRQRNIVGAVSDDADARGGTVHGWYAPLLRSDSGAGLSGLSTVEAARFLRTGKRAEAAMMGPMADVVFESLQHLSVADARAMATYLTARREIGGDRPSAASASARVEEKMRRGERVYEERCKDCHGDAGQGTEGIAALAGNEGVTAADPTNVIKVIRIGGFPAAVPGHPQPHGMPPHYDLSAQEIAAVATFIRRSWGNAASAVSTFDVDAH